MGALLALKLTFVLQEKYGIAPIALFVGAWGSPSVSYPKPKHFSIEPKELENAAPGEARKLLSSLEFIDPKVLSSRTVLLRAQKCVAAGLQICRKEEEALTATIGNQKSPLPPLTCYVATFWGTKDNFVPKQSMQHWADMVADGNMFSSHDVSNGEHLFLSNSKHATKVRETIVDVLSRIKRK